MNNLTQALRPFPARAHLLAGLFLAAMLTGCSHTRDIGSSQDQVVGQTARNNAAFVSCMQNDLNAQTQVFASKTDNGSRLLIGAADPAKASAMLELSGSGSFTAYQRDAWYDKGRFLGSALDCARLPG